jgi:hypothetical protein
LRTNGIRRNTGEGSLDVEARGKNVARRETQHAQWLTHGPTSFSAAIEAVKASQPHRYNPDPGLRGAAWSAIWMGLDELRSQGVREGWPPAQLAMVEVAKAEAAVEEAKATRSDGKSMEFRRQQ